MVDSIMLDEKRVLPCTAYLEGEYGIDGLYMGVPVQARREAAIEQILEVDLDDDEQDALARSADAVRDVVGVPQHLALHPAVDDPLPSRRMDLGLRGRTAIVCGATSGLGLASASALADEGANVTLFARRRDELEHEANRLGALAVRGDVTNAADLERLVERTVQAFGGIDIVVWNSGGPPAGHGVGDHRRQRSRRRSSCCSCPAVRLVRLALPHLERSAAGRMIASPRSTVKEPAPQLALSNAIRPGVTGWAKTLARELGPKNITVNCVAPGRIDDAAHAGGLRRRTGRRRRSSRRSRSDGSARRASSETSSASWPRSAPPTSRGRRSRSTAAASRTIL